MQNDTSTGRLQLSVFDVTRAMPVSNAIIRIRENSDEINNNNIITELITNESGQTDVVELPAPPKQNSFEPDGEQPFSKYNIEASAEGFDQVTINGVQVFPDTLAIQNIYLNRNTEEEQTINITPPTLWGNYPSKIPEEEVKNLPPETGFIVLDEVVIPEYIVVHDGSPNDDSAPNYYILFKDYIKNVASSEIYSTWPDAAIRANVLAIISFTLNRVFTEWYRSRGKNYTITSSTAYDQSFVYGRNIYEQINTVVDEMFNTYITKPGIRQPLFAQYCDGVRVSCPNWLSQWGSSYLAEDGYSAIQILRNYYGNDIYLEQAQKVSGIPSSFPGEVLTVGSRGESVRTIQRQLNSISNNYPAINKVRVDGIYGQGTRQAVETFQQAFNLPQTGAVDFATWYQISSVYVAVEKLAEL